MADQKKKTKAKDFTEFEFEDKKYIVRKPNNKVRRESDSVYANAYRHALTHNFLLDAEIDDLLDLRGFSRKDATKRRNNLIKKMRSLEVSLAKRNYETQEEGKQIAFDIMDTRDELLSVDKARNELESQSVERYAENKRFNFFAYACVVDESGERLWKDFEEFENDDSELAIKAATELLMLVYGINQDAQKEISSNRVENRWLRKHGYMNDDLQLINENRHPIDREGRLINEKGEFVNEEGHRVDMFGNLLDEEGNLLMEGDEEERMESELDLEDILEDDDEEEDLYVKTQAAT